MNTQLLACNSNITSPGVFGSNYKMNAQLLACNSNLTYANASGLNYKMNTQLLACNSNKPYSDVFGSNYKINTQTPHSGYVTLCYFNHCQHKNHLTMLYHVIDSKLQPLFTTHTAL